MGFSSKDPAPIIFTGLFLRNLSFFEVGWKGRAPDSQTVRELINFG